MPDPKEKVDPAQFVDDLAAELEATPLEPEAGDDNAENALEEGSEEVKAGEDEAEGEQPKAKANAGEDDDEAFLEAQKGKSIPYPAFQKKYEKWKKRASEEAEKARKATQAEYEAKYKDALAGEDVGRYQRLQQVFGNLDQAAKNHPFLTEALMALGKGESPDWHKLNQALGEFVKAVPGTDPHVARQLREMQERQERLENDREQERFDLEVQRHIENENREVLKVIGDDAEMMGVLNEVAAKMVPQKGSLKELPDRVALAKKLVGWAEARHSAKLKKMVVDPNKKAKASLNAGNGQGGGSIEEEVAPSYGTDEFDKWLLDGVPKK